MNDWQDLYKNQKDNPELYEMLIRYSEHFNAPFPMFIIGEATVEVLQKCLDQNREYEGKSDVIY